MIVFLTSTYISASETIDTKRSASFPERKAYKSFWEQ